MGDPLVRFFEQSTLGLLDPRLVVAGAGEEEVGKAALQARIRVIVKVDRVVIPNLCF